MNTEFVFRPPQTGEEPIVQIGDRIAATVEGALGLLGLPYDPEDIDVQPLDAVHRERRA